MNVFSTIVDFTINLLTPKLQLSSSQILNTTECRQIFHFSKRESGSYSIKNLIKIKAVLSEIVLQRSDFYSLN